MEGTLQHGMEGPVRIRNEDALARGLAHNPQAVQGGRLDPSSQSTPARTSGGDRVEFSDRARALLVASEAISKQPQIRSDKVESLKQMIKDGTYNVPGEKIAERLLGEGIFA